MTGGEVSGPNRWRSNLSALLGPFVCFYCGRPALSLRAIGGDRSVALCALHETDSRIPREGEERKGERVRISGR